MSKKVLMVCPECNQTRYVQRSHSKNFTGLCRTCSSKKHCVEMPGRKGEAHPMWKGGRYIDMSGYVIVRIPESSPYYPMANTGNRIFEHRLVIAQKVGRCLLKREIVHHLNGLKDDNRPENLCIVDNKNHNKLSLIQQLRARIIELESK